MRSLHSYITVAAAAALLPIKTLALLSSTTSTRIIRQTPTFLKSSLSTIGSRSPPPSLLSSFTVLESTIETETDKTLDLSGGSSSKNLSPFLVDMVDEQRELQMNVGKAMDVLRKDYPYFLRRAPDYSIYHTDITLKASDNTPQLSKLSSYKQTFSILRTMLSLLYDVDKSIIQSRMVYDPTKQQIRVSFNANLTPKILGGRIMHVDGISVYSIDLSKRINHQTSPPSTTTKNNEEERGKIIEHRIEKLLVNGTPLHPPYFNVFGLEDLLVSGQYGSGALVGAGAWS